MTYGIFPYGIAPYGTGARASSGGNATVNLTGAAAGTAAGTFTPQVTETFASAAAGSAAGSFTPMVGIIGAAAGSAAGGFGPSVTETPTGVAAGSGAGTAAPSVTQPVTGAAAGTSAGTFGTLITVGAITGGIRDKHRQPDFWGVKRKPTGAVELDPSNGLTARGLTALWGAGYRGGDTRGLIDLAGYGPNLTPSASAATIGVTSAGQLGAIPSGTAYFTGSYTSSYSRLAPTNTLTLAVRVAFSGTPGQGDIFGLNLNAVPNYGWGLGIDGSGHLCGFYNNGTFANLNDGTTFTPVVGQVYSIALVLDGTAGTAALYLDGVQKTSTAWSGTISYPTGSGPFIDTGSMISGSPTMQVDYAGFWGGVALSADQLRSLANDPYQLLRPVAKRPYTTAVTVNPNQTITPTGASAGSAAGLFTPLVSEPITGAAAGTAAGTETPLVTKTLTGVSAAAAASPPGPQVTTNALTGASAGSGAGTLGTAVAITGGLTIAAATASGVFAPLVTKTLTGAAAGTAAATLVQSHEIPGAAAGVAAGTFGVDAMSMHSVSGSADALLFGANPFTPESRKVYI